MPENNGESTKDTPKRFKDLLKEVEKSEQEAQKLASQMEAEERDVQNAPEPTREGGEQDAPAPLPTVSPLSSAEEGLPEGEPKGMEEEETPPAEENGIDLEADLGDDEPGPGGENASASGDELVILRDLDDRLEAVPADEMGEEPPYPTKEEEEKLKDKEIPTEERISGIQEENPPLSEEEMGDGGYESSLKKTISMQETPPKTPSWINPPAGEREEEFPWEEEAFVEPAETEVIPEPDPPPSLEETPPPPLGDTPHTPPPALDTRGMPLPRRMDEPRQKGMDTTPPPPKEMSSGERESRPSPKGQSPLAKRWSSVKGWWKRSGPGKWNWGRGLGCLLRMAVIGAFILVILALILGSFGVYHYHKVASDLPDVDNLREQAAKFETTRILDRNGEELYEILDPNAGRRTYVPLGDISPYLVAATIATEDSHFYSHPGYDVFAIARAFWTNLISDEIVSGASTITQQLTRILLFSPEERTRQTYARKIREAILAAEITRRYSKDEILELYLNEIYYGNLSYGIEAAAETYFGTSAKNLDLAQASFLAGIPQLPSVYDVYTNRELTLNRHEQVLVLMYQASQEQGCIYVSNNQQRICIGAGDAASAAEKIKNYEFKEPYGEMRYPHWVNYIRSLLEERYDAQTIYRSGFSVYTTLDPDLQDMAQEIIRGQIDSLAERHKVSNGALVALKPTTGEILAMVGSADFQNQDIQGEINMALRPRQPGSAIKPLTYLAAFEKGWTPATLIWDVPSEFPPSGDPNDPRAPYKPVNYDERFHGPVLVRSALANSYNVPAVKTLDFVGIYDDPDTPEEEGLIPFARRMGITTLTRDDYGLSLTLGGGEVTLRELMYAYATMANGGRQIPPVAITRIEDSQGNVVYEYRAPSGEQVIRPEHAFLISSILSDNEARTPAFGPNSVLKLPFPVAAKTGTTNDFRDNWTVGYTPDLAVGVWVGNADYTPMQDTSGLTGAAPIWAKFMKRAIERMTGGNPAPFVRPAGIVERVICAISGTLPSKYCPRQQSEYFAADQLPKPEEEDLWRKVEIDTWTNKLASSECSEYTKHEVGLNVDDPWAIKWIRNTNQGEMWSKSMGLTKYPYIIRDQYCSLDDPRPIIEFASPRQDDVISSSPLKIFAKVDATEKFKNYTLEYGIGLEPEEWEVLKESDEPVPSSSEVYSWDVSEIPAGWVTLRIHMNSTKGSNYAEKQIQLDMQVPTPTPTPTPTYTPTPTFTPTLTPTPTPTPTLTPTWTPTPTPTDTPTPTNTPTDTPVPTPTP
jgi:penicillin-binding protein 1C